MIRILNFILMHFVDFYPDSKNIIVDDSEALKEETRKLSAFLKKGLQKDRDKEDLK